MVKNEIQKNTIKKEISKMSKSDLKALLTQLMKRVNIQTHVMNELRTQVTDLTKLKSEFTELKMQNGDLEKRVSELQTELNSTKRQSKKPEDKKQPSKQCIYMIKANKQCKNKTVTDYCIIHSKKVVKHIDKKLPDTPVILNYEIKENAFKGYDKSYSINISENIEDPFQYLKNTTPTVAKILGKELNNHPNIKAQATIKIEFEKTNKDGEELTSQPYFNSIMKVILNRNDIPNFVNEMVNEISHRLSEYQREGSNWRFK